MEQDLDYFARRASEEREAAANAPNQAIAALHTELAERYEALLKAGEKDRGEAA